MKFRIKKKVNYFLKRIYSKLPFKKQLFTLIKNNYKPSKGVYKHLHFNGEIEIEIGSEKYFKIFHFGQHLENEIFWNGIYEGWEKFSMRIWSELCEQSNTILDVGANTGVYSLLAKSINEDAKIYAFEPVNRVYKRLVSNVDLNHFDITCINKAVSNFNGRAIIFDKNTDHIYSVTVNKDISPDPENSHEVEIQTITLKSFMENHGISNIDLLKIDVETHEVEVLEGFKEYLIKNRPTLLIEILNQKVAEGIQNLIAKLDYHYYNIDETNGVKKVDNLSTSSSYNFLIIQEKIASRIKVLAELNQTSPS